MEYLKKGESKLNRPASNRFKYYPVLLCTAILIAACVVAAGCGLQGATLSTQNIIDAIEAKETETLNGLCSQETIDFINSGFTKEIYGENLPYDYLVASLDTKNLDKLKIEIIEEKDNSAIVKVSDNKEAVYLFFTKEKDKWLFDMQNTITLAELTEKNRTISGLNKAEVTFEKDDYPTTVGLETRYFANKMYDENYNQLAPAQVSFNLEGPWDFSEGPTENEVVMTIIDKNSATDMASFPTSNFVKRIDVGDVYDDGFYLNDKDGLSLQGESNHYLISKVPTVYTYTPPWFLLKYPLKVGMTWQDSYQTSESGFAASAPYNVNRTRKVVAVNQIKTPFKSYDKCFLIQSRTEELKPSGAVVDYWYGWLVPDVGTVVEIKSLDGEVNEVFTQAKRFWRLKYQGMEQPAGAPQN